MEARVRLVLCACISAILAVHPVTAMIIESPADTVVQVGQSASFFCIVPCSNLIDWHVEGFDYSITSRTDGFEIISGGCFYDDEGNSLYNETLQVSTGMNMDRRAIQCASIPSMPGADECNTVTFSRFAILTVESPATEEPPSVTACPTPSPVQAVTITVTPTPLVVTLTQTVTQTVIVTESLAPASEPANSRSSSVVWLEVSLSTRLLASIVSVLVTALLIV